MDKVPLLKKKWVKFDQSLWGFFLYHQSRIFVVTIHWIQTFKKSGSLWIMNHVPVFQCANPHIWLVILDPKFAHPTLGHPMVVVSWHPWAIHSRFSHFNTWWVVHLQTCGTATHPLTDHSNLSHSTWGFSSTESTISSSEFRGGVNPCTPLPLVFSAMQRFDNCRCRPELLVLHGYCF